jgi:hypothetical protein
MKPWLILLVVFIILAFVAGRSRADYGVEDWEMKPLDRPILWSILSLDELNKKYQSLCRQAARSHPNTKCLDWVHGFRSGSDGYCHIFTPPITNRRGLDLLKHEVRHCTEGHWHD